MSNQSWAVILVVTGLLAQPVQALDLGETEVDVTVDFTYASQYMWHGFDIFDDQGAFHPSVEFGYRNFYFGVWGAWPDASGFEDLTEIDLYAGYGHTFFEDERYSLTADLLYTYFTYPKTNSDGDAQEILLSLSLDRLIPLGPSYLVPTYELAYDWSGVQAGEKVDDGYFHTLRLEYDIPVPPLLDQQEEQAVSLMGDITYGDGAFGTDSGFSYATLGLSTTLEWKSVYITPAIYYQASFEDTVNDEDEFFATFSIGYSF